MSNPLNRLGPVSAICVTAIVAAGCSGGGGGGSQTAFNRENAMFSRGFLFNGSQVPPLRSVITAADVYRADGIDDLIMVARGPRLLSQTPEGVFLAGGLIAGGFGEPEGIGDGAQFVPAVADFDADELMDLVFDSADLEVYFGTSGGTAFDVTLIDSAPERVESPIAGDMDGDGDPDIVAWNSTGSAHSVSVYLNQGNRTFAEVVNTVSDRGFLTGPPTDFNGDSFLDVVANYDDGRVVILPGNGDGTFGTEIVLRTDAVFVSAAIGDVNLDGITDLVTFDTPTSPPSTERYFVASYLGNGDGTFDEVLTETDWTLAAIESMYLDDATTNGIPDLIVHASVFENGMYLYEGNGDGTFDSPATQLLRGEVFGSITGDFNADGIKDIYGRALLEGLPGGGFYEDPQFDTAATPGWATTADIYGEGEEEVLFGDDISFQMILPNGNGTFTQSVPVDIPPFSIDGFGVIPTLARIGDLDNDGLDDVLLAQATFPPSSMELRSALIRADSTVDFSAPTNIALPIIEISELVDLDADGNLDLTGRENISLTEFTGPLQAMFGNGDGTFAAAVLITAEDSPAAPATADLDGDGDPSLLVRIDDDSNLRIYEVDTDRSITLEQSVDIGTARFNLAVGRLDADGQDDIALLRGVATEFGIDGRLTLYYGNSANGVDEGQSLHIGGWSSNLRVHILDLDGNGVPYVVVEQSNSDVLNRSEVRVFRRTGARAFTPLPEFRCQIGLQTQFLLRDFTLDGIHDVVSQSGSTIQVLRGQGGGEFELPLYFDLDEFGGFMHSGDWDSDGDIDLGFFGNPTVLKMNRLIP